MSLVFSLLLLLFVVVSPKGIAGLTLRRGARGGR
jgi:hypothetical protein